MNQEPYDLSSADRRLLEAAHRLCRRIVARADLPPDQMIGVAFAIHALAQSPRPLDSLEMSITVSTHLFGTTTFRLSRWWKIEFDGCASLVLGSGGWIHTSAGGESFTRFEFSVEPGEKSDRANHTASLLALDHLGPWPTEVPTFMPWVDELDAIDLDERVFQVDVSVTQYPATLSSAVYETESDQACESDGEEDDNQEAMRDLAEAWGDWIVDESPEDPPET